MISTRVSLHATRKHCKSNKVLEGIDKWISAKKGEVHSSSKWEDLQPELLLPKLGGGTGEHSQEFCNTTCRH
jgi:hypothetical protein